MSDINQSLKEKSAPDKCGAVFIRASRYLNSLLLGWRHHMLELSRRFNNIGNNKSITTWLGEMHRNNVCEHDLNWYRTH